MKTRYNGFPQMLFVVERLKAGNDIFYDKARRTEVEIWNGGRPTEYEIGRLLFMLKVSD